MRSKDAVLTNQPRLVEAGRVASLDRISSRVNLPCIPRPSHREVLRRERDSLYTLPAHDVQHLLSTTIVETSPRVAVTDVRLDVERRGGQAGVGLLRERRHGLIVRDTGPKEGPHGVDERSSVPERHCARSV